VNQQSRDLPRRLFAELLGSAFLAAVVIGSGIAAQQLSPGDIGLELFENAAATAAGLFTIILMFGPVSGGHFNPVVSLVDASFGGLSWRDALAYIPAQITGCILGAMAANAMFAEALVSISAKHRASPAHFFSEIIATLGLLLVIFSIARTKRDAAAPDAVGAYIGAAYFFTSSTSFANPAISIGRMFSNTFAGPLGTGKAKPAAVPAELRARAGRTRPQSFCFSMATHRAPQLRNHVVRDAVTARGAPGLRHRQLPRRGV
jgi:arsenate reductase